MYDKLCVEGLNTMLALVEQNLERIAAISKRRGVKRLELFGSAARGDFDPVESDLDFFVEFNDYGDPAIADHWFGLREDLAELLGHNVDLCSSRTATDPLFLNIANRHRVGLYAA
jgi:predicted nucleotidyltransferase